MSSSQRTDPLRTDHGFRIHPRVGLCELLVGDNAHGTEFHVGGCCVRDTRGERWLCLLGRPDRCPYAAPVGHTLNLILPPAGKRPPYGLHREVPPNMGVTAVAMWSSCPFTRSPLGAVGCSRLRDARRWVGGGSAPRPVNNDSEERGMATASSQRTQ